MGQGQSLLEEVFRVLKPSGIYFMVSHTPPSKRKKMLTLPDITWDIKVEKIRKFHTTNSSTLQ